MAGERANSIDRTLSCPIPLAEYPHILLAHGGGGRLMHHLLEKLVMPSFRNPVLETRHDAAVIEIGPAKVAFTTDSYVVRPLFFPGGDIGRLAVNGTVNDLATCGARPLFISAALILEEGLPIETLWRVLQSMQQAAESAGVSVVTGDTKVVERGHGDGIFINTTGVGIIEHDRQIAPQSVRPGDRVLLNGDLGRHGIAILAAREGLSFEGAIASDTAPLAELVLRLIEAGIDLHCLRDLTRGGLASALIEIAQVAGVHVEIEETALSVRPEVQGACEILGLDPIYVANEGRLVAFVAPEDAQKALALMRAHPMGVEPAIIGQVSEGLPGRVLIKSRLGVPRIVDMPSGEQLPRIC